MKNRRRLFSLIVIITASVFLSSCGITTYCLLENIDLTSDPSENTFSIKGTDDNLELVKDGPGLLLIYTESEDSVIDSSAVINDFKTKYSARSISGKMLYVADSATGEIDTNLNEKVFYTFKTESGNYASPYKFCFDLSDLKNHFTEGLNLKFTYNNNEFLLTNNDTGVCLSKLTTKASDSQSYIHVFATIGVQGTGNNAFNNIYWSDLIYVGCISKTVVEE